MTSIAQCCQQRHGSFFWTANRSSCHVVHAPLVVYQLDATLFRCRGDVIMNIVRHEREVMTRIISGSTPRQAAQPCHVQAM